MIKLEGDKNGISECGGIAVVINFLLANARLVLGVGGAAVLGIATLAVKRVRERESKGLSHPTPLSYSLSHPTNDPLRTLSHPTLSVHSLSHPIQKGLLSHPILRKVQDTDHHTTGLFLTPPTLSTLSFSPHPLPLSHSHPIQKALAPEVVHRAESLALDICIEVQGFLHSTNPDMPLGEMSLGGSLLDDLQVVRADHACLLVPLQLEPSLWRLIPGEETLLTHPLHWMVRRVNLEYFPRGRSYWDRFLVGGYLSCRALVSMLSKAVMETMNWPSLSSTLDCLVRPVLGGDELKLEIRPERGDTLFISVVPVLREADVVLTAQVELTQPWDSAWHLSLYPWETQRLTQLDSADQGVRRALLKTLKAVCRHCPALRPLTAAPLANLILHLSDKDVDWSEGCLSGRFQQCVWELIGYLEQGVLPSYFKPSVNMLNGVTEEEVDEMGFMLYCAVSEPDILLI
uniref:Mitochondrial elongation factor 1 n=1 Tax=Oncorhynchus tshawytscha TaxID=74940 RepID=A0AAZ3RF35_ONCTS